MAGTSKLWAIRCPGGPTKIVKSDRLISESTARDAYLESFNYKTCKAEVDREIPWPLLKPVDEAEAAKDFANLYIESQVTGKTPRIVEMSGAKQGK